jgi:hypothetical protein
MAGSTEPTKSRRHQCSPANVDTEQRLALTYPDEEACMDLQRRGEFLAKLHPPLR